MFFQFRKVNIALLISFGLNIFLLVFLALVVMEVYPQYIYNIDSVHNLWDRFSVRTYRAQGQDKCYFEILNGRKRIYSMTGNGEFTVETKGEYTIENSLPALVIKNWVGGAHGDSDYYIFGLSNEVLHVDTVKGLLEVEFKDIDHDGKLKICGLDKTYGYFHGFSFSNSPLPTVILSYDPIKSKFVPNKKLMAKPILPEDELNIRAQEFQNDPVWHEKSHPPTELLRDVLNLLYGNSKQQAWQLFEKSCPSDFESINEYKELLLQNASNSPFYKEITFSSD
ncbi:MAG: hypothetical protein K9M75_04140 [Phycisphaerae bacterium]|nr:hypothetical protein [Phycisphaerae bacterium]